MTTEDKIYQAYLEELQQIEKFRATHLGLFGDTPLESEDPYTKRLIESLAFFMARTRVSGVERLTQIHQRLFRQYFPYLVSPLPAFGMLQLTPSIRYPQKVILPAGSELHFKTPNNQKAFFQTLYPVEIFPLSLKKFSFEQNPEGGWRCTLEYSSLHISTEEIGSFCLYINHLNNFFPSLRVAFALQRSLQRVQAFYDTNQPQKEEGFECSFHLGFKNEDKTLFLHEIEQIRSLLHLPQQELFIHFEIPPYGKRWQTLTLCLDFNDHWPESLKLNSDSLIPFIVPIVNFKKAYADPIICDGTQDSYPILYPESSHQFELHSVIQVSELLSQGTKTLFPGILGLGKGCYEVDYFEQQLSLDLPEAFNNPKTLSILALWTQPWFSNYLHEELDLQFNEAQMFGLGTRLLGTLHRHEKITDDDPNFLIRLLSLKNQDFLNLNEILFILNAMKKLTSSLFDTIPESIQDLKIHKKIHQKNLTSIIEYEFLLNDYIGQRWEATVLFFKYIQRMLNCWLPNFDIETKIYFPQSKKPLIIKQGKDYELSALARNFFISP
jgi:type VI secretion system protein ImpG